MPESRSTVAPVIAAMGASSLADNVLGAPRTNTRCGWRRRSSVTVDGGSWVAVASSSGPPTHPATAPAASASGNCSPVATYTLSTIGSKVAAEMAAAVAKRSAPANRSSGSGGGMVVVVVVLTGRRVVVVVARRVVVVVARWVVVVVARW